MAEHDKRLRLRCAGWLILAFQAAFLLVIRSYGQDVCPALPAQYSVAGTNIFSEQQEVDLGDAQAVVLKQSVTFFTDPALTGYMQVIIDRLANNLPPSQLQFRVTLVELPDVDAFSTAGGKIYVSRKLVAMLRNEDELAGVLAHEMAHALAHHEAIRMTEAFRRTLGVTKLGNHEDVTTKWNQFLDNYRRQRLSLPDYVKAWKIQQQEQLQADAIALYAMQRTGYSTQAYANAFDRIAGTQGKTGNFWSDLFGATTPDAKRLRELLKSTPVMPPSCIQARTTSDKDFQSWQAALVAYSPEKNVELLPGLISRVPLAQRLRPELQRIQISPDGKYVLAQDENAIFVLTRQPLQALFSIEASSVRDIHFTPDSRSIVYYSTLAYGHSPPRVERWDIASQQRAEVHEIFVREGCSSGVLSRDGKLLACSGYQSNLQLLFGLPMLAREQSSLVVFDTASGAEIYRNNHSFWHLQFSPNAHYLVASGGGKNFLLDVISRRELPIAENLGHLLLSGRFAFLGNEKLIGAAVLSNQAEIVEFPSGRILEKDISVGRARISSVTQGDYVLLSPVQNNPVGVLDLKRHKVILGSKRTALDIFDGKFIAERGDGDLQMLDLAAPKSDQDLGAQLPEAPLSSLRTAAVSPDLTYLAVSQRSRGAVWNLKTSQRLYHVRGFEGAYFAPDGALYADFPSYLKTDRTVVKMTLDSSSLEPKHVFQEKEQRWSSQVGPYLLTRVQRTHASKGESRSLIGTVELREITNQKLVWTKDFPQGVELLWADPQANSLVLSWSSTYISDRDSPFGLPLKESRSEAFDTMIKQDPELSSRLQSFHDREGLYLVEAFALDTGRPITKLLLDTGKRSWSLIEPMVVGDSLIVGANVSGTNLVGANLRRVLIYSLTGEQKAAIFGHSPVASPVSQLLAVHTERSELEIYDLHTLKRRFIYDFASPVSVAAFSQDGKRLLVLTSDQVVYIFDVALDKAVG